MASGRFEPRPTVLLADTQENNQSSRQANASVLFCPEEFDSPYPNRTAFENVILGTPALAWVLPSARREAYRQRSSVASSRHRCAQIRRCVHADTCMRGCRDAQNTQQVEGRERGDSCKRVDTSHTTWPSRSWRTRLGAPVRRHNKTGEAFSVRIECAEGDGHASGRGRVSENGQAAPPANARRSNAPAGSVRPARLRAIHGAAGYSGALASFRRPAPCLSTPPAVSAGHDVEGKGLSRPGAGHCARLLAPTAVSKQRTRVQGMLLLLLLAVCATAVCSGQCPDCAGNSILLSPQDDWKAGIQDAPHGSTVLLSPGVYVGECNVEVRRNITLRGVRGRSETVLDCQQRNRHFHVTGANVTIHGLTLTNGHAHSEGGGCVLVDGKASVSILGSSLAKCQTLWNGGVVKLSQESALLLSDATELRNGTAKGRGGGVFLEEKSRLTAARKVWIVGSEAGVDGGGVYGSSASMIDLREGTEIRGCVAGGDAGGVYLGASTLRATGRVLIVDNKAVDRGGGVHGTVSSVVDVRDGAEIRGCAAGNSGGGIHLQGGSRLVAEGNVSIVDCEAGVDGGGIHGELSSVVDLREGTAIRDCVAGNDGGGVYLRGGIFTASLVAFNSNVARARDGGTMIFQDSSATVSGCTVRHGSAGRSGGCISVQGESALIARDTSLEKCVAGAAGGALAVLDRSTATLEGRMVFSRNVAGEGGGIFAQGLGLHFTGVALTVQDNQASQRGGGIASWAPVHFRSGSARLVRNAADVGGGWCGIGHKAVLSLGADATMAVEQCTAAKDGGGIALLDLAALVFDADSEPCSAACSGAQACEPSGACLTAQCNFNGEACRSKFEEAGRDALQACDRDKCGLSHQRSDRSCGNAGDCLVASCDWAEDSQPCRRVLDSLASCPLFDAVAYDSILRQGSQLVFVKEGGTANGFGRCANASCRVAQNGSDSYEWCETIDDGGRLLQQPCPNCRGRPGDVGQSWGVCSPNRPRLPSAGFDYDGASLLELLDTPVEDVMQQYPGCGRNPLRLVSNRAGRMGGGLYSSGCFSLEQSQGVCFLGNIRAGFEPSLMVLFEGNSAGAGGGFYSNCPELGECAGLMDKQLGLPSRNKTYSSILEFRDNSARYGARAASAANRLAVVGTSQVRLVPGQDPLEITLQLLDSLQQQVDGRVDPYVIEMLVCATAEGCSSVSSLQPVLFLAYDRNELRTAQRFGQFGVFVQYCTRRRGSALVKFTAVTQDRNLEATLEVECLPCQRGQSRTNLFRLGAPDVLWTCKRCSEGTYVIDPNEDKCNNCPRGLSCRGTDEVEPVVAGSTWEKTGSYFNLTSCPTGYAVVNEDEDGFNPEVQHCRPCEAGTECTAAQCTACEPCQAGHFKSFPGTEPCSECPVNTYRPGLGNTAVSACLECPDYSTTQGLTGQVSIDACMCRVNSYRQYLGASGLAVCRECPVFSTTRTLEGQVSIDACQCRPGFYSYRAVQLEADAEAELKCFACPVGATCPDGASLVTRGDLDATGQVVWGLWKEDAERGRLWLKRCPQGYRLENQTGFERQECQPAPTNMFIASNSDASFHFQKCPANMFCLNGGPPVAVPVSAALDVAGYNLSSADWAPADTEAIRQSVRAAVGDEQLQVAVGAVCFSDGTCLDPRAPQRRRLSPPQPAAPPPGAVTVRFQAGAPAWSSAELKGRLEGGAFAAAFDASVAALRGVRVRGAVRTDALQAPARGLGTYALEGAALVLKACPVGYLIVNSSIDAQECARCPSGSYSLDPTDGCVEGTCRPRDCNSCPSGAVCSGGAHFAPSHNSTWEVVRDSSAYSRMRLVGCPAGSILVRNDNRSVTDECLSCPYGKYSIDAATYPDMLWVDSASLASARCLLCKRGLQCDGESNIKARRDYWLANGFRGQATAPRQRAGGAAVAANASGHVGRSPEWGEAPQPEARQTEAILINCPPNSCLDDGVCADGHVCKPGWVMPVSGHRCRDCGSSDDVRTQRVVVGCVGGLLFLALWTYLALRPAIYGASLDFASPRWCGNVCGERSRAWIKDQFWDVRDHLKVIVSFFQVVSTYRAASSHHWGSTSSLFDNAAIFRLGLLDLQWISCTSIGASYKDMLLMYTVAPILVCALMAAPLPVLRLAGSPHLRYCIDQCWKVVGAFVFLVYPTVSIISISSFNCQRITDDVSLLVADFREPCPNDNPGGFLFTYSVICVIVFPLGIILGAFWMMWYLNVPQLAKQKVDQARIHSMILMFIKQRADLAMEGAGAGRASPVARAGFRRESRNMSLASHEEESRSRFSRRVSRYEEESRSRAGGGSRRAAQVAAPKSPRGARTPRRRVSLTPTVSSEPSMADVVGGGWCHFEGNELEEELEEEQIITLLTHNWRRTPISSLEMSEPELWTAKVTISGMKAWTEHQLRGCSRAKLLGLLRESACLLDRGGVLAVPTTKWDPDSDNEAENWAARRLGFLLMTYDPPYWYWELIELWRKFFTVCATIFVWRRSPRQMAVLLAVTLVALLATMRLRPYRSPSVSSTQIFSLVVQSATLMYGLMMQAMDASGETPWKEEGDAAYMLLLALFCMVPAFPLLIAARQRLRTEWVRRSLALPAPAPADDSGLGLSQAPIRDDSESDLGRGPFEEHLFSRRGGRAAARVSPPESTERVEVSAKDVVVDGRSPPDADALGEPRMLPEARVLRCSLRGPASADVCADLGPQRASTSTSRSGSPSPLLRGPAPPSLRTSSSGTPVELFLDDGGGVDGGHSAFGDSELPDAASGEPVLYKIEPDSDTTVAPGGGVHIGPEPRGLEAVVLEISNTGQGAQAQAEAGVAGACLEVEPEFVAC